MNKLNQIKHNLAHGLPIDSEEILNVIMELEQALDELAVANVKLVSYAAIYQTHLGSCPEKCGTEILANQFREIETLKNKNTYGLLSAEIQAKAVEDATNHNEFFDIRLGVKVCQSKHLKNYANNLRQQAKEKL